MAVRVLLLFASSVLFASAWNSDHPEMARPRLSAESRSLPDRPTQVEKGQRLLAVSEVGRAVSLSAELDASVVSPPELIASGTYRVVDSQGRVGWLSIPSDNNPERAATEPQPIYFSETVNGRWYFIRVESAAVIASPSEAPSVRR